MIGVDDVRRLAWHAVRPEARVAGPPACDTRSPIVVGLLARRTAGTCQAVVVDNVGSVALLTLAGHGVRGSRTRFAAGSIEIGTGAGAASGA